MKSLKNCKIQKDVLRRSSATGLLFGALTVQAFSSLGFASQKVDLESEAKKLKVVTLYSETDSRSLAHLPLAAFKAAAIEKKLDDCRKSYGKAWLSGKAVRGWVALNYLQCFEGTGKVDLHELTIKLNEWGREGLFQRGPWASDLKLKIVSVAFEKEVSLFPKNLIEWYMQNLELLSTAQKAALMLEKAREVKALGHWEELAFRYEQIRLLDGRLISVAELNDVYKKLNWPLLETPASASDAKRSTELKKESSPKADSAMASTELAFSERIQNRPSSKSLSEWRKEFLETFDKREKNGEGREFIKTLGAVSPTFIGDWAESLHRRGDFVSALELVKFVLDKNPNGIDDYKFYWLAGRCAQFLGKYDEALNYFSVLEMKWSETKESQEASFRKGLVFYRMKNWTESAKVMSQIRELGSDRFDLGARYWEIRALEKLQKNAEVLKQELVQRYPWSYYGLRLQAELGQGQWKMPSLPPAPVLQRKSHVWLDGEELKAFDRLKVLLQNGMQEEAHFEARLLPQFAQEFLVKALSEFYQRGHLWLPAIIQMNRAQEMEKSYLSWDITKEVFPAPYEEIYQNEAKQNKLPVELLWSLSRQESGFNTRATSTSNAMGLMQLIPPTAKEVAQKLKLKLNLPQDAYRPTVNIKMGSFYIAEVVAQFGGSIPLGLAGYNAGPHKVKKWMEQREETKAAQGLKTSEPDVEIWFDELPWSETSFYVKAILRNLTIYRLIQLEGKNKTDVNKLQSGVDLGPVWWSPN